MPDEPQQVPLRLNMELPAEAELGVFADFANIWHTQATFVLDFLSVKGPAQGGEDENGNPVGVMTSKVAARVRIPPEQIFPLMAALQVQSQQWLDETGRVAPPPESWLPPSPPADSQRQVPSDEEEQ